jgi:pimeloyl-ACP methyl ester carboxylesterase
VSRVVAIEGLGPSPAMLEKTRQTPPWERLTGWIDAMRGLAGRQPRRYESLAAAEARMREENPFLSSAQARQLTEQGMLRNEDGSYSWKFDNYVRAASAHAFDAESTYAVWKRIRCPVLLFRGTESWASDPEKDGRIRNLPTARLVNVPGAAHWVHHDRLEPFLAELQAFLRER